MSLYTKTNASAVESAPSTIWKEGWVRPRVGLNTVEEKESLSCQKSNLSHPANQI
jgi:hypothetical protein